jgi:hypothetical protein
MARQNRSKTENQTVGSKDVSIQSETNRETRIMNTIINTSVIIMSVMVEAFAGVMVEATGAMATGMVNAIGGEKAGEKVEKEFEQKLPEVNEKMKTMISEARKDAYAQFKQKEKEIQHALSNPAFDIGPKIVEKYDFKLPKLTEALDDKTLAQYTLLLLSEDTLFSEMFKELTRWMNGLPKFPAETAETKKVNV